LPAPAIGAGIIALDIAIGVAILAGMIDSKGRQDLISILERITQTALARKLGVSQPTVSAWKDGSSRPDAVMRRALALAVGIPEDAWLTEDETARIAALAPTGTNGQ
jgi:DNA-binding XRE family transcriptional regulator